MNTRTSFATDAVSVFIIHEGKAAGPYERNDVVSWVINRSVPRETLGRLQGASQWMPLDQLLERELAAFSPAVPKPKPITPVSRAQSERVFFDSRGVQITASRCIIGAHTYVVRNLTSVRIGIIPPNTNGSTALTTIGMFGFLAAVVSFSVGQSAGSVGWALLCLALAVVGVRMGWAAKPSYSLYIGTAAGESHAITDPDRDFVGSISKAIDEAIASA